MDSSTSEREVYAFQLAAHLLDRLHCLAQESGVSIDDYVECILLDAAYNKPNETTVKPSEDAKDGKYEGTQDVTSVESMLKSIGL